MTADTPNRYLSRTIPRAKAGVVHLGMGAFFRAHGAVYLSEAMGQMDRNWGVIGVSLRSPGVRDKLALADYLYSAVEVSDSGTKPQIIDVVNEVLVAPQDVEKTLNAMADPCIKIVSLTVTEKGYCRGEGGETIDLQNPDIIHDIAHTNPKTAPGLIVRALERRWRAGIRPFTVLSLDNLPSNGTVTREVVTKFAKSIDADLASWIEAECRFPSTMVDRIVPATTPEFVERLGVEIGIHDPSAVGHEPFRQWVIEDDFVDGCRPEFEKTTAQLVSDVEPFEDMKLRMLNGTHSALAYIGILAGHTLVSEAIRDPEIALFIDRLWEMEIAPSIQAPDGVDLEDYAGDLKSRYLNSEIKHRLEQIAMDGSQKLPQRILNTMFENIAAGRCHDGLLAVIAAWMKYLESCVHAGQLDQINDPLQDELCAAITASSDNAGLVANFFALRAVFENYAVVQIEDDLVAVLDRIDQSGIGGALKVIKT